MQKPNHKGINVNTSRDMAREVTDWARKNENIRAVILTSSRANPHAPVDALSDYDIELYVADLEPFLKGNEWLEAFGEILIREPPRPGLFGEGNAGCMVIFKDAPRQEIRGIRARGESPMGSA